MKKVLSAMILMVAMLVASCGGADNAIVGKWNFQLFGETGWIEFNADGTYTSDSGPGTWEKDGEKIIFEVGQPNETTTTIKEMSGNKMVLSYDDWGFEIELNKE